MNQNTQEQEQYLKRFGVFVGLFNRATGNGLNVKDALKSAEMISLFEKTCTQFNEVKDIAERVPKKQPSTKRRSLDKTDVSHLQKKVLAYLKANPKSSRRDIENGTGMFLQSVLGRVSELLDKKLIYVSGEKLDNLTNREVEVLSAVAQDSTINDEN